MEIIDWLKINHKWLFDGIGVACIFGLFDFFYRRHIKLNENGKKSLSNTIVQGDLTAFGNSTIQQNNANSIIINNHQTTTNENISSSKSHEDTKPTPFQIRDEISETQPFLRETKKQSYVGLKVKWKVYFHDIKKEPFKSKLYKAHVVYKNRPDISSVFFTVDLEKYPMFKTIKSGEPIWVSGEIEMVDGFITYLKKCHIEFRE